MNSVVARYCLIVAVVLFSPLAAFGCSCISSGAPCQAYWNTSVIFSGQVSAVSISTSTEAPNAGYEQKSVRFRFDRIFRGDLDATAEIITGMGGGDCGYNFEAGKSYLVYAYRNPKNNKLYAGICSRTRLLAEAGEDLEYLQNLATAKPGGVIYGTVNKRRRVADEQPYQPPPPLANVRVSVEGGDGKIFTAATDEAGKYRVSGLATGKYKISAAVPAGLWGNEPASEVSVNEKGCAEVGFWVEPKTALSGRVLTENGEPAAKIKVNLVAIEQINERYQKNTHFAFADETGRYEFKSLPPGKYYLGVRLDRINEPRFAYPRTFYPGTKNVAAAVSVSIAEGETLENYDFQLPKALATRKISGTVLLPDGKPASGVGICFEEVEYAEESMCYGDTEVAPDGSFSAVRLDGLRYLVRAHAGFPDGQRHAEPVEIPASGDVENIKLTIDQPNGGCEKCRRWARRKN